VNGLWSRLQRGWLQRAGLQRAGLQRGSGWAASRRGSSRSTFVMLWMLATLVLLGGALACAPDSPSGVREMLCGGTGCSAECRALEVKRCDVRKRACQELIFQSVRCVRGSDLTALPRIEFVPGFGSSDEQVVDAGTPEGPSPEEVAFEVWNAAIDEGLQLLRLIATPLAVAQNEEEGNVGGKVQDGAVSFDDGSADAAWRSMKLLAHEYVHTMQEHDYGGLQRLYARYSRSNVTSQGLQAFIEGEAELYSWLAHAFMRNTELDGWDLDAYLELEQKWQRDAVARAPSPWTSARMWQHYAIGAQYLYRVWKQGHNVAVRSVLYNLDADFARWASGFEPRPRPSAPLPRLCNPEENYPIVQDALGPSGVFSILIAAAKARKSTPIPSEPAWRLATDVVRDQLRMYAPTLDQADTQVAWLAREAKAARCRVLSGEANGSFTVDGGATDAGVGGATTLEHGSHRHVDAGVCDTDVASSDVNGGVMVSEDTPFAVLQTRLVPNGAVWVSWQLEFTNADSAKQVEQWIAEAGWATLRVERDDKTVILRARRAARTEEEARAFASWTCR
jgi:hypothetical protein